MKVKQVFRLPFDQIVRDLMDKLAWFFSSCCHVDVSIILEEVAQVSERFLPIFKVLWQITSFLFRKSFIMLHVFPIPITLWTIL
jgi:hypothetical protein